MKYLISIPIIILSIGLGALANNSRGKWYEYLVGVTGLCLGLVGGVLFEKFLTYLINS